MISRRLGALFLIFAALLIRYFSAKGDLWLDEIWSLKMALGVQSLFDIVTSLHHDNNHYLNTVVFYLFGDQVPGIYYRIPSIVAGGLSIVAIFFLLTFKSDVQRTITAVLFCFSYWMVHYTSEARGYAYVVLFVLIAYGLLQKLRENPNKNLVIAFNLTCILGFLSHLTFMHAYLGFGAWLIWNLKQEKKSNEEGVKILLPMFGPSLGFLLFLYAVDLRFLQIGGGNIAPLWNVISETFGWVIAGSDESISIVVSVLLFILTGVYFVKNKSEIGTELPFYLTTIVLSPFLFVAATQPPFLYPRYFIVPSVALLILFGKALGNAYERRGGLRFAAITIGVAYLLANLFATIEFWKVGRGSYSHAMNKIVSSSKSAKITLGSDHDFRNSTVIGYYARALPPDKSIHYFPRGSWTSTEPEWLLSHQFNPDITPLRIIDDNTEGGNFYMLDSFYPSSKLSGWSWALYHKNIK